MVISASDLGSLAPTLVITAVLLVVVVRRAVQAVRGAPVSPARLLGLPVLFLLLFALVLLAGAMALPLYWIGVDAVVVVVAAWIAGAYVRRHVDLERRPPSGEWFYRLGPAVPILFLALFGVRFAIDIVVLGQASPLGAPGGGPAPALSPTTAVIVIGVDLLFALSAGLLVGRSVGVFLARRSTQRSEGERPE